MVAGNRPTAASLPAVEQVLGTLIGAGFSPADAFATVQAVGNLVIGSAIGGYGARMLVVMLPHGPVELAAYSLALALYLSGRRRALPAARMAVVACARVALLALAAALETWVSP